MTNPPFDPWWLFRADYRVFVLAVQQWLSGGNPYGDLGGRFTAGAFAYPPTFLTWATPFAALGPHGYWLWTALNLVGWAWVMRRAGWNQWPLLIWAPIFLHLWIGQCTLTVVLVLWAAYLERAARATGTPWRSLAWGLALAWCATKPQTAFLPMLGLLWDERRAPQRWALWAGLLGGTLLLALPPTLRHPAIWSEWLIGMRAYSTRQLVSAAWQGPSLVAYAAATVVWWQSTRNRVLPHGNWRWWITATAFPQTTFYSMVALLPVMDVRRNRWHLAGLLLSALMQVQTPLTPLPWILALQALAGWLVAGGPLSQTASHEIAPPEDGTPELRSPFAKRRGLTSS